jgi:hypothetical protein
MPIAGVFIVLTAIKIVANIMTNTHLDLEFLVRAISKDGGITESEWLEYVKKFTDEEVVAMYCTVRDESMRMENEWRPELVTALADRANLLPPIGHPLEDGLLGLLASGAANDLQEYCEYLTDVMDEQLDLDWVNSEGRSIKNSLSLIPESYREKIVALGSQ